MKVPEKLKDCYVDGRSKWSSPDREWLYDQYRTQGKSAWLIAKELGTYPNRVYFWLRKVGMPTRSYEEAWEIRRLREGSPLDTQTQKKRLLEREDIPLRCSWCGCADGEGPSRKVNKLVMHHRDHDRENGMIENLAWMCPTCHYLESWLWVAQKERKVTLKPLGNNQLLITLRR